MLMKGLTVDAMLDPRDDVHDGPVRGMDDVGE
jgi:hypothetical protein